MTGVVTAVPPLMIADALEAHAGSLEWEVCDAGGTPAAVAADLRRIAADIRSTAPFTPGDRVHWQFARRRRAGTIADLSGECIDVLPDDDPRSLVPICAHQLTKFVATFTKGI